MKQEFEAYRNRRGIQKEMVSGRIPDDLKAEAELIAEVEGDTLSGLVIEGIARVVQDRQNDPGFSVKMREALEGKERDLQDQLEATRKLLGSAAVETQA